MKLLQREEVNVGVEAEVQEVVVENVERTMAAGVVVVGIVLGLGHHPLPGPVPDRPLLPELLLTREMQNEGAG
jgi:hypothetical protein